MDFNRVFYAYDNIDGANCQTAFCKNMSQREAAEEKAELIEKNVSIGYGTRKGVTL